MERLTMPHGICDMVSTKCCASQTDCYYCGHGRKVFKRLSAYEDTGLTPEEINILKAEAALKAKE